MAGNRLFGSGQNPLLQTQADGSPDPDATAGWMQLYQDWKQRNDAMPPLADWLRGAAGEYATALLLGTTSPAMSAEMALGRSAFLASRNARMYNLPSKSAVANDALAEGVGNAASADSSLAGARQGNVDPEGRRLVAGTIVGRRSPGGADQPLSPSDIDAVTAQVTGRLPEAVPANEIQGDAGQFQRRVSPDGMVSYRVLFNQGLPDGIKPLVQTHELGHALDTLSGEIPTEGLMGELSQVYNLQNNPNSYQSKLFGPAQNGYKKPADQQRELMAEALRGYMQTPEAFKALAPKTAAAIRAAINAHPTLSKAIQFNAAGGIAFIAGDDAP